MIGKEHFRELFYHNNATSTTIAGEVKQQKQMRILELGSGTGLLGLVAAVLWRSHVILTDLPLFQDNLFYNIDKNNGILKQRAANVTCDVLDWTDPDNGLRKSQDKEFEVSLQFTSRHNSNSINR